MEQPDHRGFTLVELLITLAVVGVIASLAVASFRSLIQDFRRSSYANALVGALHLAKSEAIKRGKSVVLCISTNSTSCSTTSTSWEAGWLIWVDSDGDATVDSDEILRVNSAMESGYTLRANTQATRAITFFSNGRPNIASTAVFALCANNAVTQMDAVLVRATGPIRTAKDSNGDRIPEDDTGTNISCTP